MARRRGEADAEAFKVVDGTPQGAQFDLASAATAGIDVQDRQAAAQPRLPACIHPIGERRRRVHISRLWRAGDRTTKQRTSQKTPQSHRSAPELDRPSDAMINGRSST